MMGGLFATLIAAAQGTEQVAAPRPLARYEVRLSPELGAEWHEPDSGSDDGATDGVTVDLVGTRKTDPAVHGEGGAAFPASSTTPRLSVSGEAPPHLIRVSPQSPTPHPVGDTDGFDHSIPGHSQAQNRRAQIHKEMHRQAGMADASAPLLNITRPKPEPLLPPTVPRATDPDAARFIAGHAVSEVPPLNGQRELNAGVSAPGALTTKSENDTGPIIRIGRIEVRQPPPPPIKPPPAASARPIAVPRAAVRQSLDDYRMSRRR